MTVVKTVSMTRFEEALMDVSRCISNTTVSGFVNTLAITYGQNQKV